MNTKNGKRMVLLATARKLCGTPSAVLLSLVLSTRPAVADIIPPDRLAPWQGNVGVPGGIPNRKTIFVNVKTTENSTYRCAGDGATDDTAALTAAIKACPANQVVYVPAGTYKLNSRVLVQFRNNYTLRGDGPGRTIFLCSEGSGSFELGTAEYPTPKSPKLTVTGRATSGSTALTLDDTSTINVGNFITLYMDTPSWMHTLNGTDAGGNIFRMLFKVVSKTSTTITVAPKIPTNVSGMNPKIVAWGNGNNGRLTVGVGFEDFTINATSGSSFPIKLQQAWGCWFNNIEVSGTTSRQMFLPYVCATEVRHCYTHGTQGTGPNHEGIDFQRDSCWNLIEDNICVDGGKPAIVLGDGQGGCVGNVIAYNYIVNEELGGGEVFNAGISDSHGNGGNTLNLYEGNVCPGFKSDGYYGGSSFGTLFRNYFHNTSIDLGPVAVQLNHYANYFNLVGNVLGSLDTASHYDSEVAGGYRTLIYRLGYPNTGNNGYGGGTEGSPNPDYGDKRTIGPSGPPDYAQSPSNLSNAQALDLNVKHTIIRHGNFDYATNSTVWDSSINDHDLPSSFYLSQKPSWWGTLRWPPIGPDRTPMVTAIPAEIRFRNLPALPSSPSNLSVSPTPARHRTDSSQPYNELGSPHPGLRSPRVLLP